MTDFRALCAELVELLEDEWYGVTREPSALVNARTLLSQPEPQGPDLTACDLLERFIDYFWDEQDAESFPNAAALVAQARALLAQPEPQGPSELELEAIELKLWDKHRTKGYMGEEFMYDNDFSAALDEYRDLLARPEPQGPTDAELDALFTEVDQGGECQSWRAFARAVLARWGTPATTGEQQ
jgi:hypothetical protein